MNKKLLFIISIILLTSSLQAGKVYRLKMATAWPTNFPIFDAVAKNMAKYAKEMSNGQLQIRVDSKNKHKAPFEILNMVKKGMYDIGHSASYFNKGKDLNTIFFTTMPFGLTTMEQYGWFYHGEGIALMNEVYSKYNVLAFPGGNTGTQMSGWFNKEIKTLKDLQGLKMRIPGFAGEILSSLGVLVTNIAPGELYTSLDRGTIDAVEWAGPSLDVKMGFAKIAKYYYTGWHEPAAELQFIVNKKTMEKLPPRLQNILKYAMKLAAYEMYTLTYHENIKELANLKQKFPNVEIKTFPKEVMNAIKQANEKLLKKYALKDAMFAKILKSQQEYKAKASAWTKIEQGK